MGKCIPALKGMYGSTVSNMYVYIVYGPELVYGWGGRSWYRFFLSLS